MTPSKVAVLCVAVVGAACLSPPSDVARRWSVGEVLDGGAPDFGGFLREGIVLREGAAVPWQAPGFEGPARLDAGEVGLVIHPGVSDGASAPFLVTDIWDHHPIPWVEPVWMSLNGDRERPDGVKNIFSVTPESTFYSPFWVMDMLPGAVKSTPPIQPTTARDALAHPQHVTGPLVLCPVLPAPGALAGGHDPITGAALKAPKFTDGFDADGKVIFYADFGPNRFEADGQLPVSSRAYFFVGERGLVLPAAAVLPSNPVAHSFVTRFDVGFAKFPDGGLAGAVYVPSTRVDVRAAFEDAGVAARAPRPHPSNDGDLKHALMAVTDPTCFTTPGDGGLADCHWLDSEAAVLSSGLPVVERPIQFAIGVLSP